MDYQGCMSMHEHTICWGFPPLPSEISCYDITIRQEHGEILGLKIQLLTAFIMKEGDQVGADPYRFPPFTEIGQIFRNDSETQEKGL